MIVDDKVTTPFSDDVGLQRGPRRAVVVEACDACRGESARSMGRSRRGRTSVDLERGCVKETTVEEGFETGLVERMCGLVDGHVGVFEPSVVETRRLQEDVAKSDSHPTLVKICNLLCNTSVAGTETVPYESSLESLYPRSLTSHFASHRLPQPVDLAGCVVFFSQSDVARGYVCRVSVMTCVCVCVFFACAWVSLQPAILAQIEGGAHVLPRTHVSRTGMDAELATVVRPVQVAVAVAYLSLSLAIHLSGFNTSSWMPLESLSLRLLLFHAVLFCSVRIGEMRYVPGTLKLHTPRQHAVHYQYERTRIGEQNPQARPRLGVGGVPCGLTKRTSDVPLLPGAYMNGTSMYNFFRNKTDPCHWLTRVDAFPKQCLTARY